MENLTDFYPTDYGPVFSGLLGRERLNPLGPGSPISDVRDELQDLTMIKAFAHTRVVDENMAKCCISALWLLFNYLEESHTISQGIHAISGSYWHGLMHRREPDFFNSKYWFRKVGEHPLFADLNRIAARVAANAEPHPSIQFLLKQKHWNPFDFIDLCRACLNGQSPHDLLARQIQQYEWELLFDYCYDKASGK